MRTDNIQRRFPWVLLVLLAGCATQPAIERSGLELQAFQADEFETSKRIAFSATMSVFQDMGFIIDDGDFETGLITATGPTEMDEGSVPSWVEVLFSGQSLTVSKQRRATAFVETMPSGLTRIRLNFVFSSRNVSGAKPPTTQPIHDPVLYQKTFAQIDKAIFVRTQGR